MKAAKRCDPDHTARNSAYTGIEDRDREKGIYRVHFIDSESSNSGFFSGLFGKKKADQHYQVLVKEVTMKSQVSVLDKDGKAEKSEAAGHLLAKLYEQLK